MGALTLFKIEPSALYSRKDLIENLKPLDIDADAWLGRVKPLKRFRMAWLGEDLMDAIHKAPALADRPEAANLPAASNRGNRTRRRGTPSARPGAQLGAYLAELKGQQV